MNIWCRRRRRKRRRQWQRKKKRTALVRPEIFLTSRKINSKWLCYEKGDMFCSISREGGEIGKKMNAFVKGTANLKLETIKDHGISKSQKSGTFET